MKKIYRWTAVYETLVDETENPAIRIDNRVPGSICQDDTFEVEEVRDATPEEISEHEENNHAAIKPATHAS